MDYALEEVERDVLISKQAQTSRHESGREERDVSKTEQSEQEEEGSGERVRAGLWKKARQTRTNTDKQT